MNALNNGDFSAEEYGFEANNHNIGKKYNNLNLKDYLYKINKIKLLSAKEEIHYAKLIAQGDTNAKEVMVNSNLRLVAHIARGYLNRGVALDDLIEEGNLGLIHASGKFDPSKGFRFSTYATYWIRQHIERCIMNQSRSVRIPIHVIKMLSKVIRSSSEKNVLDKNYDIEEISKQFNIAPKNIDKILSLQDNNIFLDTNKTKAEYISVTDEFLHEDLVSNIDEQKIIHNIVKQLNPIQQNVIKYKFGLFNHKESSVDEISQILNISIEQIKKIYIESLKAIKKIMKQNNKVKKNIKI